MLKLSRFKSIVLAATVAVSTAFPVIPVSATESMSANDVSQYVSPQADVVGPEPVATATTSVEPMGTTRDYELHKPASECLGKATASLNKQHYADNYTRQMGAGMALQSYMMTAQPSDAVFFNANTNTAVVCSDTLERQSNANPYGANQISINYEAGLLDLPRLDARYYYSIKQVDTAPVNSEEGGPYGFSVKRTFYPSLSWTQRVPANTSVMLDVMSADTNQSLRTVTVKFDTDQDGLPSDWEDCSKYVLGDALDNAYQALYRTAEITWYPAELHRSCFVTPHYIVGHYDDWGPGGDAGHRNTLDWFIKTFNVSSGTTTPLAQYLVSNPIKEFTSFRNQATSADVKGLVWPYISGETRPSYLAMFSPHGNSIIYNANTGKVQSAAGTSAENMTILDKSQSLRGVYAVGFGTTFDVVTVQPTLFNSSLDDISDASPAKTLDNGTTYNFEEMYGRFMFKEWATAHASDGFDVSNYPTIQYNGAERETVNLYGTALAYGGVLPNVARLTAQAPIAHYTIVTRYTVPDSTSSQPILCEELSVALDGTAPNLKTPTQHVPMYTFDRWYTDQACTVPADILTIHQNARADDVVQLYGKYNYTGGTYTVQFYNDASGESTTSTFECRQQPTLPPTPTRTGYLFRNWQIVYNTASTNGTIYSPDTFAPTPNTNYTFKTFWDVEGVITNVSTNQSDYYVGDKIDKSKVVVTVQTDNNGTTRTLSTEEFTVSPDTVSSTGRNQIQVTYIATGATATFDVNGRAVQPVALTARYNGSALNVGATISRSNIQCTVNYSNGTSETVTDFTIAPATVANAGSNTIRVIYGSLSTTITVTGNRPSSSTGGTAGGGSGSGNTQRPTITQRPTTGGSNSGSGSSSSNKNNGTTARLQSLSAAYTGAQPYVGDVLRSSDISVTASYSDGSSTVLSSTAFQFSPSFIRDSGDNTITVSYGGLTTQFTVTALIQSSVADSSGIGTTGGGGGQVVIGTDDQGNPIYGEPGTTPTGTAVTNTGLVDTVSTGTVLGNPLTGAGMPSSGQGTSTGYMRGSNILTSRLYGGNASDITNSTDILMEINSAGESASSVDIELYNGASGNDITPDMLEALKEKELVLNVSMLNPDDKTTVVGQWQVLGSELQNTSASFNPNITFEVTQKGVENLTYMSIADGTYPDSTTLTVIPAVSTYATGELIRIYTCGFDKSNAHNIGTFKWSETSNPLNFDFTQSTRYALSNALDAYEEGSSLLTDISRPSENESAESGEEPAEELTGEEPFDFEDPFEDFDFSDDPEEEEESKGFSIMPFIFGGFAMLALAAGAACFVLLRRKTPRVPVDEFTDDEELFEQQEFADDEIGDDEQYDMEDSATEYNDEDSYVEDDEGEPK